MKTIALALFLLPVFANAQDPTPGDHLKTFHKQFHTGLTINGIGLGLTAMVAFVAKPDDTDVYYLTTGIALAGWVVMMQSFRHIGKAGERMNESKLGVTFNNGIGLRYRI